MDKAYLSQEQRKCHTFIQRVICDTIERYGSALLDCGHTVDGSTKLPEIVLVEQADGTFIALCPECGWSKQ